MEEYYQQPSQYGFTWGEFGTSIGNAATSAFDYVGGTLDANAANSQATANINNALADSIKENAKSKAESRKMIIKVIFAAIVLLAVVSIFKIYNK